MESSEKIAALQMLQNIIDRMASNSLQMKKWSITIIIGLIGVAITSKGISHKYLFCLLPLLTIIPFAVLDIIYLKKERDFVSAFNKISELKNSNFLNINYYVGSEISTKKMWSVWLFYIPLLLISTVTIWTSLYV
ncbi:hypothetical protein [Proteus mirabilis]|uniref:hypothetical protein n=1 Tax=Proteus mirabilis TaxID=584 RepID=UPI0024E18DA7|nr:hypothetical protein [Proteus mirabilis]